MRVDLLVSVGLTLLLVEFLIGGKCQKDKREKTQAQKLCWAMAGALRAMAEQAEKGGEDHG